MIFHILDIGDSFFIAKNETQKIIRRIAVCCILNIQLACCRTVQQTAQIRINHLLRT